MTTEEFNNLQPGNIIKYETARHGFVYFIVTSRPFAHSFTYVRSRRGKTQRVNMYCMNMPPFPNKKHWNHADEGSAIMYSGEVIA